MSDADSPLDSSKNLTSGSVGKHLFGMAAPMLVGSVAMASTEVVDAFFVGQLGTRPLAALTFCMPVVFFASGIASGFGTAVQSIVSRAVGNNDSRKSRRITTHAFLLMVAVAAVLATCGLTFLRPLFGTLGADPPVIPLISSYITIWFVALPLMLVPMILGATMMALGDARTTTLIMIGGSILNVVLDPLLIFGIGFLPEFGLAGAALASAISRGAVTAVMLGVLWSRSQIGAGSGGIFQGFYESSVDLFRIGGPATGARILDPIIVAVLTRILSGFGESPVAAFGAGSRILTLTEIVFNALGIGLVPVIGQNWGAGLEDRVEQALSLAERVCIGWGIVTWAGFALGSSVVASAFVYDPETVQDLTLFLMIVPASTIGTGLSHTGHSVLNAIDRPLSAGMISVAGVVLKIPLVWLASLWFDLPLVFASMVLASLLTGVVGYGLPKYILARLSPPTQ